MSFFYQFGLSDVAHEHPSCFATRKLIGICYRIVWCHARLVMSPVVGTLALGPMLLFGIAMLEQITIQPKN